jgi:predicted glycoside hydrolase/deacetylase ChbG (UPF0249 family)
MLHADDAGLNPSVNRAIIELIKQERLESVSVIANSKHTADFVKALLELWPNLSQPPQVFLHFNIVEGRPLAIWPESSNRVGPDGNFYYGYNGVVKSLLARKISPDAVQFELEAQYQCLTSLGLYITGIDSHQHMHALAPIAEIVEKFADEHSVRIIRSYDDMHAQTLKGIYKLLLFRLLAISTEQLYYGRPRLPSSWKGHTWREFVMTSWEPIHYDKIRKGQIIACHPGSDVDRGFTP